MVLAVLLAIERPVFSHALEFATRGLDASHWSENYRATLGRLCGRSVIPIADDTNRDLIRTTVSGALAVKRRRTKSSAAERERQALLRRAAMGLRRAVHSGAARSAWQLHHAERLDRGTLRVVELPCGTAFL